MTSHDELLDSVAAYALGLLSPAQAQEVAAHLQTCEGCREEYRFLGPAVTAVASSAESCAEPTSGANVASPLLKARVMRRVREEAAARPPGSRVWPAYAFAAACLAIAIITGFVNLTLKKQINEGTALNALQQRTIAGLATQTSAQQQTIADLTAADSQRHNFAGGEVLTRGQRLYLAMRGLPQPARGHVYQAWTLPKGSKTMVPSVTFEPSTSGATIVRLPVVATAVAVVAVSVEPEGGSKQPTTKPIAVVPI
jgi:anti-sigma-K factor RskA